MPVSFDSVSLKEPIVLVCAADDNYSMPLAATLHSAIVNVKSTQNIALFVIDGGISRTNKRKILQAIPSQGVTFRWLKPKKSLFKNMQTSQSITIAAYYRLLIPHLLPNSFTKAIYLDSDLIVRGNLEELWNIDIGENYLLAAQDMGAPYVSSSRGLINYQALGIPKDCKYFNSGVLVLNLKKWREDNMSDRVIEYLKQNKDYIRWHDQDGLNAVLAGKWGELDPRWNQMPYIFKFVSWQESPFNQEVYNALIHDPYIVHFSTREKPWKPNCNHPLRNLFFQHLDMEIWSDWYSQQEAKKKIHPLQRALNNRYTQLKQLIKKVIYE
ncbi:MAG: glycosyltransferase family 8 protein [Scytonema sp. PMC 1069.18]|nr:glycosyltransferase family 8 protein [Scytonema sp. PMC 1069.18]MEC4885975.1 glycosyltransferase family 8 protein [Scytonema sp. PMC 1070.18]